MIYAKYCSRCRKKLIRHWDTKWTKLCYNETPKTPETMYAYGKYKFLYVHCPKIKNPDRDIIILNDDEVGHHWSIEGSKTILYPKSEYIYCGKTR